MRVENADQEKSEARPIYVATTASAFSIKVGLLKPFEVKRNALQQTSCISSLQKYFDWRVATGILLACLW